ncbi:site-specific integrase [uncultured Luteimonas sp.]|uniref:site-specific integrase n=1 Tax=uncultured Luteimonas sp. TaxID=453144 RepID=UPI00261135AA|nr:site-specific integrase [uncultured Luteimonas sp.]
MLYLDFFYRGVRCREQTTLPDTAENRRRVQTLMNRISKEIKQGLFDYSATFPGSTKAAQFAGLPAAVGNVALTTARGNFLPAAPAIPDTPSFSDFSVTWRKEMAPQWRRQHRDSVDATFDAHLLAEFGDRPVGSITKADVLTFRARLAELPGRSSQKLSPTTVNRTMGLLRQCLTEASERFGTPDPFKGVRRLKGRRPDVKPFSLEEVEKVRTTIRPDYRNYVTCRFFTGMRTGEINGLKWKYVDFEHEVIKVREVFSAGEAEENAKTESSIRDIPMLPMVKEALRQQWEERDPDVEYVFCSRAGNPIDAHNFANRIWYPLLRYLELEKRRPYQTRHTTATLMLASGENPEWIARLMGHTNTQMLFTVYSRFVPNLTRQDGLAFAGLLSRQSATPSEPRLTAKDIDELDPEDLRELLKRQIASNKEPGRRARS